MGATFVSMMQDHADAFVELNGTEFGGRAIQIDYSQPVAPAEEY